VSRLPSQARSSFFEKQAQGLSRLGVASRDQVLDYHLKTGHTLSVQNRPTGLAEDVIVLPCCRVRLQG
jgi:hypothetical protein